MKIRVVQLANGRWICECKAWHWFRWRAPYFVERASKEATRYGGVELELRFAAHGTPFYPVMAMATKQEAVRVQQEVCAFFGEQK